MLNMPKMLTYTLDLQQAFQARLADLEARLRQNNIRIHGIPEGVEADNTKTILEELFKNEPSLTDTPFRIQRCHRSLGAEPQQGANPRSVLVYFLEYATKKRVLRSAWQKKAVNCSGKRIFFGQDYPMDILAKRKVHSSIRKALKEKEILFQTLHPAKLKVFFDTGLITYNSAEEATDDLRMRGLILGGSRAETGTQNTRPAQTRWPPWETVHSKSCQRLESHVKNIQTS